MRPEGFGQWKSPMTPSGIEPAYLQVCNAVPQPTTQPRSPIITAIMMMIIIIIITAILNQTMDIN